ALVFAVVSGAGAVVKALGVDNVWWVAGVTAVVTAVGSVMAPRFESRWDKWAEERENRRQAVDRAALRGGRLQVRDITNPKVLGVHPARLPEGVDADDKAEFDLPVYVRRDRHDDVAAHLKPGGFVLIAGVSAAGKTRLAFEVVSVRLFELRLLVPVGSGCLLAIVLAAAANRKCGVWLVDLFRLFADGRL